jgi:hypothetical protein
VLSHSLSHSFSGLFWLSFSGHSMA